MRSESVHDRAEIIGGTILVHHTRRISRINGNFAIDEY